MHLHAMCCMGHPGIGPFEFLFDTWTNEVMSLGRRTSRTLITYLGTTETKAHTNRLKIRTLGIKKLKKII